MRHGLRIQRRYLHNFIAACMIVALQLGVMIPVAHADDSVTLAEGFYTIELVSVVVNPDGTQTWTYNVRENATDPDGLPWASGTFKGLSHWVLGLCDDALDDFVSGSAVPSAGFTLQTTLLGKKKVQLVGAKWETPDFSVGGFQSDNFQFTLSQKYPIAGVGFATVSDEGTDVGVKGGKYPNYGQIAGPSCEPTYVELADFSAAA
ncbi:MAG: hypothetical protein KDD84_10865, partial [Caldilineaceae bacterium]|nr:hypothetical protein [Caldilineaceae bacterium]